MRKEDLDTPEILLDLKILKRNLKRMQEIADKAKVRLRPMTKTHKMPEISKMQVKEGSRGISVAKLEEAEVMADGGINDIFIANLIIGEKKVERMVNLAKRVAITTAVDSVDGAAAISNIAEKHGMKINTLIEVDVGNGRCGVLPGKPSLQLAQAIKGFRGINLRGIYTHEGNVMASSTEQEMKEKALKATKDMVDTKKLLESNGIPVEVVTIGSTPAAPFNADYPGITEIRPGTYAIGDTSCVNYGYCGLEDCAVSILFTIISKPAPDRVIGDAGSKQIGPPVEFMRFKDGGVYSDWGKIEVGRIVDLKHKPLPGVNLEKSHEEYGIITLGSNAPELKIGDKLEIIPFHVCPSLNLWDRVTVIEDGEVKTTWPILGRGKPK